MTVTVCSHCKRREPSNRLYRLWNIGLRVLCRDCFDALDKLGMRVTAA